MSTKQEGKDSIIVEPSLPKLLQALALGVKAVHSLPISVKGNESDDDSDLSENEDDEFSYLMAFPEFSSICLEARQLLVELLNEAMQTSLDADILDNVHPASHLIDGALDFDHPVFWDAAAEACEVLLDRVEMFMQSVREKNIDGFTDDKITSAIKRAGKAARAKAKGGWNVLMQSLVDMEKPQTVYEFQDTINNSRTEPFIPTLHPLQPFKNTSVNDLEYADGHGLDTRNGKAQRNKNIPDDVIAPKVHYLHPYHDEISSFQCDPSDLTIPYDKNKIPLHGIGGTLFNSSMSRVEGIWIDNESDLIELCDRILREDIREIAIDLEAHSYRSFSGFVCLMQISLRRPSRPSLSSGLVPENEGSISTAYDFLIDTLCLRKVINSHLAPIFANPDILKVMHGANSDIQWLQRDFGIYVINLFDTGIATRYLPHLGSHGLAKILSTFANVQSDKKHQLSDWRERPLRQEMRSYAVSDTIYLLDLYDRLKLELSIHNRQPDIVQVVFEESKQICLLRYDKEPFYPSAYKRLINWRKENSTTDDIRENVLKELFDWRDRIARELDESLHYVCPDAILVRVAFNCPVAISALQAIIKPMPPLVLSHASEIIDLIRSEASPQSAHNNVPIKNSSFNSAVLISNSSANTEKSVQCEDNFNSSDVNNIKEEGDLPSDIEEEEMIERNVVEVHSANKDFIASSYTPHSAEMLHLPPEGDVDDKMSISACTRGQTVDGLGAITSALASEQESAPSGVSINNTIKDECLEAKKSAVQIHQKIAESYSNKFKWNQPIAASSDSKIYHDDESDESVGSNIQDNNERDNALPRSLREIYRISNQNRVRSRDDTTLSELSLSLLQGVESYPVDTIEGANNVIMSSGPGGSNYFDVFHESKRQRALNPVVTGDANIEFMKDIGWFDNEEEVKEAAVEASLNARTMIASENKASISRKGKQDIPTQLHGKHNMNNPRANANTDSAALYDPKEPPKTNPYFTGAAIRGQPDTSNSKKKDVKSDRVFRQQSSAGDRRSGTGSGNKTFVYRK